MNRNICTLFDINYLSRGLALYHSLCQHCPQFTLWILCMDDQSYQLLSKLALKNIKLLKLSEVEDDNLKRVKATRTSTEYCWMFSSSLPLYILEKNPNIDMVSYIDADIYFFDSIEKIYQEFADNSIMIIPHNFSKKHLKQEIRSGIYNVGMMIFRNDHNGLACLKWWKNKVIEWCFNRYEDGKFGDQLYLNNWPTIFNKVYVLQNQGANVASWNIDRFIFMPQNEKIIGIDKNTSELFPLIFFHFHGLKMYLSKSKKVHFYPISVCQKMIYKKYRQAMTKIYTEIWKTDPSYYCGFSKKLDIFRFIKQYLTQLI